MLKFPESSKNHFNWGSKLDKKLYESLNEDEQKIYIRVNENLYAEVELVNTRTVRVIDFDSPLFDCTISGKIEIFGEPIGEFIDSRS